MKLPAAALCLVLTGCSFAAGQHSAVPDRAAELFAARTPYLGDNNRVFLLISGVGPVTAGGYTMELQTGHAPLGLTVNLKQPVKAFTETDFNQAATLLLGLIANVDEVTFAAGGETHTFTSTSASKTAGFDVKKLGKDQKVLAEYLSKTDH